VSRLGLLRIEENLRRHQLCLGAVGTDDVFILVGDEAATDKRCLAAAADEAVVVPVTVFEGDEASAADA
jgi:hypothetical protein